MTDLIEKVARAICKSRTGKGVGCCQWPSNAGEKHRCTVLDGFGEGARAAIAIVLEETAKMAENDAIFMQTIAISSGETTEEEVRVNCYLAAAIRAMKGHAHG